jgi:uncharacterized protein YndB with AHSA1/START domain
MVAYGLSARLATDELRYLEEQPMTVEPATAVHRAVVLPVDRERAWDAITDAEQLACWLADEVELDPRAGGAAVFRWADGEQRDAVVEDVVDEQRISWSWQDGRGEESLVELTLDEVEGGTRVSVVEVQCSALRRGDATLAPAGVPSPWTPRMAALSACCATCWA